LIVREYKVLAKKLPVREGLVGPQYDRVMKQTFKGGDTQLEMILDWRKNDWKDYLVRTGVEKKLN